MHAEDVVAPLTAKCLHNL